MNDDDDPRAVPLDRRILELLHGATIKKLRPGEVAELSRAITHAKIDARQTSPEVSSIAARYLAMSDEDLLRAMVDEPEAVIRDLRAMAGSCLSQDETPAEPTEGDES